MGNKYPLVTVIIATYNSPITLQCAIQSVLNQDFKDFEVLVIGDCCPVEYGNVVNNFNDDRLHWFNLPQNVGSQYGPNNEGIKRSRGKYIAYLGHDDLWFSNHLSSLVGYLEETDSDLVHCLSTLISPIGAYKVIGPPANGRNYSNCHVPPSSWLYKKSLTDECGLWHKQELLSVGADQDYLNRIALFGKKIKFYNNLMVLKFVSGDWGLYSKKNNFPQLYYLEKLEKDPKKLIEETLFELAARFSMTYAERKPILVSLRSLLGNTLFYLFKFSTRNKWPLNKIRIYIYQRVRRKNRKFRGLEN